MVAIICPHCQDASGVVRFGFNRSGTARCRCSFCKKTFTLDPKPTKLTETKRADIERALTERISQRGIARTLGVSRDTIRAVRKKSQSIS
jgi:transposase-like protein